MPRRVPVQLDLNAAQYLAEARKVEASTKVMDTEMGALDRAVDKVDRDMAELAVTTRVAARQVDNLGDEARGTAADLKLLETRINAARASARALGIEFARSGDASMLSERRKELSIAAQLERLRKEIEKTGGGGGLGVTLGSAAGTRAGQGFASGLTDTLGNMRTRPALIAALVGAGVAAAPVIGAMLGGAIAGATGTAAMAAGILSAAKNERVQAAAKSFGQSISEQFFAGGGAFVEPVIHGLDILEQGFGDMHVPDALAKMAPTVTVIAEGFADFGRNIMPGFNKALDRMGPFAAVAAEGFGDMGDAFSEFLDDVTRSPGTLEGLATLFHVLNETIMFTGNAIEFLSDRWHTMLDNTALVTGALEDMYPKWHPLHDVFADANDQIEDMIGLGGNLNGTFRKIGPEAIDPFVGYLHEAWAKTAQLRGETEANRMALVDYFDTLRGIADADIAWEQAIDDLTESVKENGRTLDITTEKGRNNVRAVYDAIDAAKRQYQTGKITLEQYNAEIKALVELGVKAGLSRKALEDLAGKYTIDVFVNVIAPAVAKGANAIATAVLGAFYHSVSASGGSNRHESFASGGVTPAFAPFEVHSGEMLWSNKEHYVSTAAQTQALPWAGSSGGGSLPPLSLTVQMIDPMTGAATRKLLITDALNRGQANSTVAAAYP